MSAANTLAGMDQVPAELSARDFIHVFQLLFNTAAEGLLVVDGSGTILLNNPRLERMFGFDAGTLKGRNVDELLPAASRSRHAQHRAGYHAHPVERSMGRGMELWGSRKDGSTFPVEVSLNHFEWDGRRCVMGLVTDITLRHNAEAELQRSNQELEARVEQRTAELRAAERSVREALEKERELHQLKSRFVSMASHEFRTPLSTVMSSVDLIARYSGEDERTSKHITRIRAKVREMTAMLNEFLSMERIEQGLVTVTPTEFDVVHQCIEQIEELRALAKQGQSIDYDHQGEERAVVSDHLMFGHVVSNLITNAIKYSPEDSAITVRTHIANGTLHFWVEDHGIGIPKEDQQHLFERFFRGANAMTVQGTGLGLNIVKRYLDLLQGTIAFTSEPGKTSFHVTLPQRYHNEQETER